MSKLSRLRRLWAAEPTVTRTIERDPVVVGIGASAGGLDALKKFFSAMPAQCGMSFVVVQHLDPTHESLMAYLLGRHTSMTVVEVEDRMSVEANRVYLNPPARYMSIESGVLRLTKRTDRREMRMPIDYFLLSLAEKHQEKSIGIILSGTGTDGTLGLKAIKAHGGMAMVQDPEASLFDGMPRSAVATGVVDYVLSLEQMPEVLIKHAHNSCIHATEKAGSVSKTTADDLNRILVHLRTRTKHDFRLYKKNTVMSCIERRVALNHLDQATDYLNFLRKNPTEVRQLTQHLLIGATGFFRQPEAFRYLQAKVLSRLMKEKEDNTPLRVWVPGCSTGEEPYSIAMLLLERLSKDKRTCEVRIFSTDIDEETLTFARRGVYPETIRAVVSPERLGRFFTREGNSYQVTKQVRESVIFSVQNLISDPGFSRLDLISCRNLLSYLEPEVQRKIISRFSFSLNDDGYLFLGRSESTGRKDNLFHPVSKKWRIYRRVGPPRSAAADFPILPVLPGVEVHATSLASKELPISPSPLAVLIRTMVLEHYAPIWVLVNDNQEVVHFHGAIGMYLNMPNRECTTDVLSLAPMSMRKKLGAALQQAIRGEETVTTNNLLVKRDLGRLCVRFTIRPVTGFKSIGGLFLIIFESGLDSPPPTTPKGRAAGSVTDKKLVPQLWHELKSTRERLRRVLEQIEAQNQELKASNHGVMSVNEELQAANEKLQASQEELQSLNEELSTVNSELQEKVDELTGINNDLANLLSSTDIATIFLDMNFCIKRFSPATKKIWNLLPSDLGRPISDILQKFLSEELLVGAEMIHKGLTPSEKEVQTDNGEWYTMRVLPYRTMENKVDGIIVTFSDVTRLKEASEELARRARQQAAVADLGHQALAQELEPQALMDEAVKIIVDALQSEKSCVFEFLPDSEALQLRAGVGWKTDCVGRATVPTGTSSYPGFALRSSVPVIFEDLSTETRFKSPKFLLDHGVVSGSSVVIRGSSGPFGLLGAYSSQKRGFTEYEHRFLQSVANVLAHAIERTRHEEDLRMVNQTLEERVAQRTDFVNLLQDVVVIANEAYSVDKAFLIALERICRHMHWPAGHAYMSRSGDYREFFDQGIWFVAWPNRFKELMELSRKREFKLGVGMAGRVAASGKPEWIRNINDHEDFIHAGRVQDLGVKAACAFPVLIKKRVVAVLEFFATEVAAPDEPLLEVMAHIGAQLGRVVERQRLQQELFDAVWQQQRHFGQELHDNLGQQLAGVAMMAKSLEQKLKAKSLPVADAATELLGVIQGAQHQVRSLAKGLFPVQVEAHGLMSGLEELALNTKARHGVSCTFEYKQPVPLKDNNTATHLFWIAQEAVTNAVMHGKAKQIVIGLKARGRSIALTVRDDGVGILRGAEHREGTGLRIMEHRASIMGGTLDIAPAEGGGTLITCNLRQEDINVHQEH